MPGWNLLPRLREWMKRMPMYSTEPLYISTIFIIASMPISSAKSAIAGLLMSSMRMSCAHLGITRRSPPPFVLRARRRAWP